MAESMKLISVFIGSPSGLEEERRAARNIVEELNRDHSRHWGCMLELVGWEETLPGRGRPQELINKDLDRCEYFIGVLYDRWGSPTMPDGSGYSSGFEEEFERAKQRMLSGKMKDMAVYFKEIPVERKCDPGPSLTKVIDFKENCFARKDALYANFRDMAGFESLIRARLNAIGWAEFETLQASLGPSELALMPKKPDKTSQTGKDEKATLLSAPTEAFLIDMMQRSSEWEATSASDVARLRLIGSSFTRSGNDNSVLGPHDANILFLQRHEIDLSSEEIRALTDCGIAGFKHQNVPLWHWMARQFRTDPELSHLRISAAFGDEEQQANSIKLLMLLSQDSPQIEEIINREITIQSWLKEDAKPEVFQAAVTYLQKQGMSEDIPLLETCYGEATSQRKADIGQIIVAIDTKLGEAQALGRVLDLGIDEVNNSLCDQIFALPSSLTTELLTRSLRSSSSNVRRRAISILNEREATDPSIAEDLLSDPDYIVRYFAAEALRIAGRELEDEVVEKVLTIVKPRQAFGLAKTEKDTQYFDRYRKNRLSELGYNDLRRIVDEGGVFDEDETIALFQKHTGKIKDVLRRHLQDGFSEYFELRLVKLRSEPGLESKTIARTENLIPYMQRCMLAAGTEALAKLNDKRDLPLLRNVLDRFEVDISEALLSFLGRFGDWNDLRRINALGETSSRRTDTWLIPTPPALPAKATAMVSVARQRIADLLDEDLSAMQRRAILHQLQTNHVRGLSDEVILAALNHKDDESRAIMALKCCEYLPKKRLKELLKRYTEHDEYRYYNSIHWLDMGVSMTRDTAQSVAQLELSFRK